MKAGSVKYEMPEKLAKVILADRKGEGKNMPPKDYLVKYVNEQYGLLHECVEVIVQVDKA